MRRAGVTLIELVVALTLAAAVFTAGYGAVTVVLDRRDAASETLAEDLAAAAVRSTLLEWLSAISLPPGSTHPVFNGMDGIHEGRADDELTFLTSAATPLGDGVATVRLHIDRNDRTTDTGLVAEISRWLGTARMRVVLVPDADGLDVRYRSRLLTGREWHPSWISSSVVPAGVELRILGPDSAAIHPLLTLPIRMSIRGGR